MNNMEKQTYKKEVIIKFIKNIFCYPLGYDNDGYNKAVKEVLDKSNKWINARTIRNIKKGKI